MATEQIPYYFFEYDRPPGANGRPRKPARTTWRMTIEEAAARGQGYRPLLETVEYRPKWDGVIRDYEPHRPGTGPVHWGKDGWKGRGVK